MALTFDNERSAMRAHVGHAADDAFVIGRENEWLVQATVEQREREDSSRRFDARRIPDPLPALREYSIFLQLEVIRIGIDPSR